MPESTLLSLLDATKLAHTSAAGRESGIAYTPPPLPVMLEGLVEYNCAEGGMYAQIGGKHRQ